MANNSDLVAIAYHVEERINSNFGSRVTTYDVSNLSLISTNDLGPNNTRIVTPKFAKAKAVAVAVANIERPTVPIDIITATIKPIKVATVAPEVEKVKYVNIDILSTYERVLDKGYKSVDMLKRVANNRYFNGDLVIAAKWYSQLFDITTDLEPAFYYRYAESLKAVGQIKKGNEMMAIFEAKNTQK
ncbi:MAG TPA: hypothetical protein VK623_05500 [Flavobacterium sp.]|nr:hypothetical protein [Flavobacterium sp.]